MSRRNPTPEQLAVPHWRGPLPKIVIKMNEYGDYEGKIFWNHKEVDREYASNFNYCLKLCKRTRIKLMEKILKGEKI